MSNLTKKEVEELYRELVELEKWTNPKPDASQWPPAGWVEHPSAPGYYFRVLSESELREEIFGSEEKEKWLKEAKKRVGEIKAALTPYFFPNPKDEGTQRRTKGGFVAVLKTGISRKIDVEALDAVLKNCNKLAKKLDLDTDVEHAVIDYKPALKLKEYKALPEELKKTFENALIITPESPKLEVVRSN